MWGVMRPAAWFFCGSPFAATARMVSDAEPGLYQAGFGKTCPGGYVDRPGHGYLGDSCGTGGWGWRMMPSAATLMSMLGPMLEIGPRVLLAMACGLLALAAVRISTRAIRQRCAACSSRAGRSGLSVSAVPGSALQAWLSTAARRCCRACRTR